MTQISFGAESTTLTLNNTVLDDFEAGDYLILAFVNPLTSRSVGSKNNVNIKSRVDSGVATLTINVMALSDSDIFLNSASNSEKPTVFNGSIMESFTKDGADGVENFELSGGSFTVQPEHTKNNQDINTLRKYTIEFRNARRIL